MVLWQQIFSILALTDDFPFKIPCKKCFGIVVFPLWRRDLVLELQIASLYVAVAHNSFVFCNSVCADRRGMAASRVLAAAAAGIMLLCFAAESCKSYCNGCTKVANGALAADFLHFGTDDFLFSFFN